MAERKYTTAELRRALALAPSVVGAARLVGMSQGALRKRASKDAGLHAVYARCLSRGKAQSGHRYEIAEKKAKPR